VMQSRRAMLELEAQQLDLLKQLDQIKSVQRVGRFGTAKIRL
jgi:hypothetical protein